MSQGKSHVCSLNLKRYLTHFMQPENFPDIPFSLERTPSFLAQLNLSPFAPPDLDMRVDTPAFSGKGSRNSHRTSGRGRSHKEIQDIASWVVPPSERPLFPGLLLIRTRFPDTSSNATLCMKSQHEKALTPLWIIWKNPQVPNTA